MRKHNIARATAWDLTEVILGAAVQVHRALGPGLLESAYEECLRFELERQGLKVSQQVPVPIVYKGLTLECGYRLDLVVQNLVIVEVKAVETLHRVHEAQAITYLKLTGLDVALLLNFNVFSLKEGIRRFTRRAPADAEPATSACQGPG
ncbi:MAG: GxxExxY protein [Deltaproteobacteria bacterium]|nr:GxxExxY protein [Deltaproteobacteria bacterium]